MALFLRDEEIRETVRMDRMLEAIEEAQHHYGQGEADNLGRRKIIAGTGMLSVLGGGLYYKGVFGVKTYTTVADKYNFHIALYDATTGRLLAFLQANRLGQLRTGATTGVAVKYLAPEDAKEIGIIGTGNQAVTQLEAVCKVRDVTRIRAYSRDRDKRNRFARQMSCDLVLSQLGFGNCLRKRLRLLPFFRSVDVGGWQPWDENGMWSGWKGKNETSWND